MALWKLKGWKPNNWHLQSHQAVRLFSEDMKREVFFLFESIYNPTVRWDDSVKSTLLFVLQCFIVLWCGLLIFKRFPALVFFTQKFAALILCVLSHNWWQFDAIFIHPYQYSIITGPTFTRFSFPPDKKGKNEKKSLNNWGSGFLNSDSFLVLNLGITLTVTVFFIVFGPGPKFHRTKQMSQFELITKSKDWLFFFWMTMTYGRG